MKHLVNKSSPLIIAIALGVAACGGTPVHEQEDFSADSPFQRRIAVAPDRACEAARLALLSQGYVMKDAPELEIKSVKNFQPEEDQHVIIDFSVVCALTRRGTTLYANAVETRYDLKKTGQSAGLSIPSVGSISLPWGAKAESLVKVGGSTLTDEEFYGRFFQLVEQQLGIMPSR